MLRGQVERRPVKVLHIRSGIRNEHAQRSERLACLGEHPADILRLGDVRLDQGRVGPPLLHKAGGLFPVVLVLEVMDANTRNTAFGKLHSDPAADPARAAGHECTRGGYLDGVHSSPASVNWVVLSTVS